MGSSLSHETTSTLAPCAVHFHVRDLGRFTFGLPDEGCSPVRHKWCLCHHMVHTCRGLKLASVCEAVVLKCHALAGDALFQTHENMEHLAMMEAVLGPIPKPMAQAAKGTQNCFVGRDSRLNWPADASKRSIRYGRLLVHNLPRCCVQMPHCDHCLSLVVYSCTHVQHPAGPQHAQRNTFPSKHLTAMLSLWSKRT